MNNSYSHPTNAIQHNINPCPLPNALLQSDETHPIQSSNRNTFVTTTPTNEMNPVEHSSTSSTQEITKNGTLENQANTVICSSPQQSLSCDKEGDQTITPEKNQPLSSLGSDVRSSSLENIPKTSSKSMFEKDIADDENNQKNHRPEKSIAANSTDADNAPIITNITACPRTGEADQSKRNLFEKGMLIFGVKHYQCLKM